MKQELTVKQFLDTFPPHTRTLAEKLRKIIQTTIPNHSEAVYPGWGLIGYRTAGGRGSKYFGFIAPVSEGVKLGFEYGVLLPDPDNILLGKGNQVRYLLITSQHQITKKKIAPLVWEAAMLAVDQTLQLQRLR